jgi:hypothetical protein
MKDEYCRSLKMNMEMNILQQEERLGTILESIMMMMMMMMMNLMKKRKD